MREIKRHIEGVEISQIMKSVDECSGKVDRQRRRIRSHVKDVEVGGERGACLEAPCHQYRRPELVIEKLVMS